MSGRNTVISLVATPLIGIVRRYSDGLLAGQALAFQPVTIELTTRHRLPVMVAQRGDVEAGGLISYFPDNGELFRRTAMYVDRILKGAKPGELPVEQPTKFELAVNLKTARALGFDVPPSLLLRADRVVE